MRRALPDPRHPARTVGALTGLDSCATERASAMVRTVGASQSGGASVETDPWIPLSVTWASTLSDMPLYLFLKDPTEGFIELKVHPENGALIQFTVIDLPRACHKERSVGQAPTQPGTATIARDMWPWTVTPDYREPARRRLDITCPLTSSVSGQRLTVWFSDDSPTAHLTTDEVTVTISQAGTLLAISAPWPPEAAELWPLKPAEPS